MAFTVYRSTDSSAPTLTGETGKLNALLQAILVDGYGSKAAAGWTCPFNTTDAVRVFKNGTGSSGRYWRVRDDGPNVTSTYKEAWIRGYGTKADVNDTSDANNTLPFPTAAQHTDGDVIRKSTAASSSARVWTIYADAKSCMGFVYTGDTAGNAIPFFFGDYYDLLGSAGLNALIMANGTENDSTSTNYPMGSFGNTNGAYLMQGYTGAGAAISGGLYAIGPTLSVSLASGCIPFPNGPDGGRYLGQVALFEGSASSSVAYRGRIRGLWYPLAGQATYADGDTLTGTGALALRTFNYHKCFSTNIFYAVETSDTLETN